MSEVLVPAEFSSLGEEVEDKLEHEPYREVGEESVVCVPRDFRDEARGWSGMWRLEGPGGGGKGTLVGTQAGVFSRC